MKTLTVLLALLVSFPAFAGKELAAKNGCLACHMVDKKLVGPSYQDVAKKYAKQKGAEALLAVSIKKGGSGKWSTAAMPPQSGLSDADAKALAKWILGGAK